ncbi:uncharacterized protein LOC123204640 isoform X2 [Mangifera indica]|uniref:uncharacterized protein LOC123204640 isoform X2 n=1 Tax=Mangifera indica TaxID=29780 RepID=UPI001CF9E034|nr:uncharacterized protein LOC123204640 isoform X2 [Mangifera indica]
MQRGRRGRDPFFNFGDPFAGFGGFDDSFGGPRSLMSSFFGGRDPFDDPFFTSPFGGMPESNFFGSTGSPFLHMQPSTIIENQLPEPKRSRGPVIEELNSDDEKEEAVEEKKENPRKHGRSSTGPIVEDPHDVVEGGRNKHLQYSSDYSLFNGAQPQPQSQSHSFTFSSSTVSYGGANGAYYTYSNTRRTGSDGLAIEENKEADSASRQATHKISRGLHNKGHSVTRKLNSDGKVDTLQTLHNLNEDELVDFEKAWDGNARKHLRGWTGHISGHNNMVAGGSNSGWNEEASRGGWALPSTERSQNIADRPGSTSRTQPMMFKNSSHVRGRMGHPGGSSRD